MEIEKLDLSSMNIVEEQKAKLKELFPEVFTEGGKIDFERLKATLGEDVDTGKERYGMNWPGKSDCFKNIQQPSIATLVPCPEESVDFDTTENLFIEGDNLEVLKLLQKSYLGKIKMIYIDPPYNTGNEFIYPDNYTESLETYLSYTGQIDDERRKFSTNTETEGRFHSKWLNMMYPRLFLAKNLLRDDGVIFISIDDHEVDNLKKLCNEIFGEENFISNLIWKSRQIVDSRSQDGVSIDHEYIMVIKKISSRLMGKAIDRTKYSNPDNDPRGNWMSNSILGLATKSQRPNLHYDLINPKTGISYKCPDSTGWRYSPDTMNQKIGEGRIVFPNNPSGRPREKKFLSELSNEFTNYSSIINSDLAGYTLNGTRELRDLLNENIFPFPKPVNLLKNLLKQGLNDNDIILDFFAGSCTTAHAVLDFNREDDGNRKFICVQLPEPTDPNSEAHKSGYKTIADIGKERIRRVIKKISEQNNGKLKFEENIIDLGFKVFKLAPSNFKVWNANVEKNPGAVQQQLFDYIDHISHISRDEAILYEILLKSGFELATKVEKLDIAGKAVFSVAEGELMVCLEKELTKELFRTIAEKKPPRFVCLDRGFQNDDQLKTNAVQTMKNKGVEFRTV